MIFWASDDFIAQKSLDVGALAARRTGPYSHDVVFHSIFGFFDIKSEIYRSDLDIFSASRIAERMAGATMSTAGRREPHRYP